MKHNLKTRPIFAYENGIPRGASMKLYIEKTMTYHKNLIEELEQLKQNQREWIKKTEESKETIVTDLINEILGEK